MKILYIEDDANLRRTMLRMLTRHFNMASFKTAESYSEAVELLKASALSGQFSLVLSDYNLIGTRTGGDVLEWIRGHMPHLESRFVFLSANAETQKYGVRCLEKLSEPSVIRDTLTQMLFTPSET